MSHRKDLIDTAILHALAIKTAVNKYKRRGGLIVGGNASFGNSSCDDGSSSGSESSDGKYEIYGGGILSAVARVFTPAERIGVDAVKAAEAAKLAEAAAARAAALASTRTAASAVHTAATAAADAARAVTATSSRIRTIAGRAMTGANVAALGLGIGLPLEQIDAEAKAKVAAARVAAENAVRSSEMSTVNANLTSTIKGSADTQTRYFTGQTETQAIINAKSLENLSTQAAAYTALIASFNTPEIVTTTPAAPPAVNPIQTAPPTTTAPLPSLPAVPSSVPPPRPPAVVSAPPTQLPSVRHPVRGGIKFVTLESSYFPYSYRSGADILSNY